MKQDKIIEVVFNFEELLKEVEELSKSHRLSIGLTRMIVDKKLDSQDPWFEFKDGKWAIFLADEDYLYAHPYSVVCEEYLGEKHKK